MNIFNENNNIKDQNQTLALNEDERSGSGLNTTIALDWELKTTTLRQFSVGGHGPVPTKRSVYGVNMNYWSEKRP